MFYSFLDYPTQPAKGKRTQYTSLSGFVRFFSRASCTKISLAWIHGALQHMLLSKHPFFPQSFYQKHIRICGQKPGCSDNIFTMKHSMNSQADEKIRTKMHEKNVQNGTKNVNCVHPAYVDFYSYKGP